MIPLSAAMTALQKLEFRQALNACPLVGRTAFQGKRLHFGNRGMALDERLGGGAGANNYTHGESVYYIRNGPVAVRNPRFEFYNGACGPDEVAGANDIAIEAGFTFSGGSAFPVTFSSGGVIKPTLVPGQRLWSDSVPVIIPPFEVVAIRTGVYVNSGQTWPIGYVNYHTNDQGVASTDQTSRVLQNTGGLGVPSGGAGNQHGFGPWAMTAEYDDPDIAVTILGDSHGTGNTGANGNTYGDRGTLSYGLAEVPSGRVAYCKMARDSAYLDSYGNPWSANTKMRFEQLEFATHVIIFLGTNDVGAKTLAAMQALYQKIWAKARGGGRKVVQITLPPRQISSSNTAPFGTSWAVGGVRDQVNEWIKAQVGTPGGPDEVIDFNPIWESTSAPGTWNATYTSDGTHANEAGMQAAKGLVTAAAARWRNEFNGVMAI
jgi:lysophospholipase L1-like esterase